MAKKLCAAGIILIALLGLGSCGKKNDNKVVIYASTEDFRTEHIQKLLKERFPDYDITVQFLSTGNHAAKLKAEGTSTEADISICLEESYLENVKDVFADLSSYDASEFLPELVPAHRRYLPWDRGSASIIINRKMLNDRGLPVPTSYADLLKPEYKDLVSMANPKTSGSAYSFLKSLVNAWGEDEALAYFDKFAENVLQFTTSGSGPVNALIQGEAAVALGMTFHAVEVMNKDGADLEILFFEEGAPYNITGMAMIKGKETRPAVKEVFDFTMTKLVRDDKELFLPEQIMVNQTNNIPNYPRNIPYADMTGAQDMAEKERILNKWKY
ncbi:extracellular solute-binding protein [Breznakiella homolactica]|uniref:Extracellular solute-binding protein n=1 Tax=Breznakiella homolactica TaxID=2798577 RepID=A0A7T7XP99_9SPIR|nr:extracellular solute-binding protein [Breznakiella homolactica]QQO10019.1 extracellular solute-binding protein [Breznakiella homolactica]